MANIKNMCENLGISEGKTSKEFLFTLEAVNIFFYKENIGEIDIKTGFTDGANDGGIDFIYPTSEKLYLIQGKSSKTLSLEEIKNVFHKMKETVSKFNEKNYDDFSNILKQSYLNAYDLLNDDKNIEFILFTNTILSDQIKDELRNFSEEEPFNEHTLSFYDKNDIDLRKAVLYQDSDFIQEDSIKIIKNSSNKNNFLSYGDNGLIVNVSANSIKELYNKYNPKNGSHKLFSYNLREHIYQKNVDNGIDATIANEPQKFWYYNNGITIGCSDYYIDGNKIKLYDFSIINGAQTTTKIGEAKSKINGEHDFSIVCKIIRSPEGLNQEENFISRISEASNSQKPIRPRDLKANSPEQKLLQTNCAQNGNYSLAIEIKRGVKPKNYKKVQELWQKTTNEYIGQLVWACIFQRPSSARNNKNTLFSSDSLYKQIFMRKFDCNTLFDLVKIGNIFDNYSNEMASKTEDLDKIAILKNGKFTILAIFVYLFKKQQGIVDNHSSKDLHKDNVSGFIISHYSGDDLEGCTKRLFSFIIRTLTATYKTNKETLKVTSCSNFFKRDELYDEYVLRDFDNLDEWDKAKISEYMKIFSNEV